tara:strand:+ start:792 stop:1388 length:597 start_codon:yes stop_codon:yes gene_type:complete
MSLYIDNVVSVYTLMDALQAHFKAHGLELSEEEFQDYPSIKYRDVVYERTKSGKFRKDKEGRRIIDQKKTEWRTVYLNDDSELHLSLAIKEKPAEKKVENTLTLLPSEIEKLKKHYEEIITRPEYIKFRKKHPTTHKHWERVDVIDTGTSHRFERTFDLCIYFADNQDCCVVYEVHSDEYQIYTDRQKKYDLVGKTTN